MKDVHRKENTTARLVEARMKEEGESGACGDILQRGKGGFSGRRLQGPPEGLGGHWTSQGGVRVKLVQPSITRKCVSGRLQGF